MRTIDPEGAELAALAEVADLRGLRVLEVGSGRGRLVWRYAGEAASVVGIDPDAEIVEEARRETPPELADRVQFEVGDVAELARPPRSFDLAFLAWSL